MTDEEKIIFKKKLLQKSIAIIEERIASCNHAMSEAQEAANSEEKSSAGDKYETSRAMNHLEKDMYAKQLIANKLELAALASIDCNKIYSLASPGCIVECKRFLFFIAAGLGKINYEGENIFLLSSHAPVAKNLLNKKVGDFILFNKEETEIMNIY